MPRYDQQRAKRTPPHVSLADLRAAVGLTLDQVCDRITQEFPELAPTRGAISAIELGHRGASAQMLAALCAAYGLPLGAITTDYEPRQREAVPA
jgi:transcriptional regulator with XRE-family HTH domain